MILTEKAKEDFYNWFLTDYIPSTRPDYKKFTDIQIWGKFKRMGETIQYAIIQEWFDSVGIYVIVRPEGIPNDFSLPFDKDLGKYWDSYCAFNYEAEIALTNSTSSLSRNEALKQALTAANDYYNTI